ncbi:MAG: hypothetical protein DCO96_05020 [Fluviicola sp. XM-24bin1]|nr:MAG: hypothetical protein DCO96_05020 [Fluviicola sp. XM-24bin1]
MSAYLKKKPGIRDLHARTFILHLSGSVLTAVVITLFVNESIPLAFYGLIAAYFAVDSIFFHYFIQSRHKIKHSVAAPESDILDDDL